MELRNIFDLLQLLVQLLEVSGCSTVRPVHLDQRCDDVLGRGESLLLTLYVREARQIQHALEGEKREMGMSICRYTTLTRLGNMDRLYL